jgi:hypothetical protein
MPKALNSSMCPQCGCTKRSPQSAISYQHLFTCGELVTEVQGTFTASYTCRTIPQAYMLLEQAVLDAAKGYATLARFGTRTMVIVGDMLSDPKPQTFPSDTLIMRRLLRDGMVETAGRGEYKLTMWGRVLSSKILET